MYVSAASRITINCAVKIITSVFQKIQTAVVLMVDVVADQRQVSCLRPHDHDHKA